MRSEYNVWKKIRLKRLFDQKSNKLFITPLDHGTTYGPIDGLKYYLETIKELSSARVKNFVLHKGILRKIHEISQLPQGNYIMHLSVSTNLSFDKSFKVLASSVEEAIKLGAVGVSVHVNLGSKYENQMIKELGKVSEVCMKWGMTLLAMMYISDKETNCNNIVHAARLAEELGADIVKIEYPGGVKETKKITDIINIPVVIAGGTKLEKKEDVLKMINRVIEGGASGIAIGRNIFQDKNKGPLANAIAKLLFDGLNLEECLSELKTI